MYDVANGGRVHIMYTDVGYRVYEYHLRTNLSLFIIIQRQNLYVEAL